jgi:hypothetical protein
MREGGGLVGRRVVGRLGVGRSFPKKDFDSRVGQKESGMKTVPRKKKTELGNRNLAEKRTRRKKKLLNR